METAVEENFWYLPKLSVQGQLSDKWDVPAREAPDQSGLSQDTCPDESVIDMNQSEPLADLDEALTRPRRYQVEAVLIGPNNVAPRIDECGFRISENHGRITVEYLDATRERFWIEQIITVGPPEVLA